jgi:hypothetical protein
MAITSIKLCANTEVTTDKGSCKVADLPVDCLIRGYDTRSNRPYWGKLVSVSPSEPSHCIRITIQNVKSEILAGEVGLYTPAGWQKVRAIPTTALGPCTFNPRQRMVRTLRYVEDMVDCECRILDVTEIDNVEVSGILIGTHS